PRDGKPLSSYREYERWEKLNEVADEIAEIAQEIADRNRAAGAASESSAPPASPATSPPSPSARSPPQIVEIRDRHSLEQWLAGKSQGVAVAIAVRAALRAVPLTVPGARDASGIGYASTFLSSAFRAMAAARTATNGQAE